MKSDFKIGKLLLGALYISITAAILIAVTLIAPVRALHIPKVILGGSEIVVTIADTPPLQEKGLSGHKPLAPNEGMLFVFPQSGLEGFWMKDMLFPLDIIWFDENKRVVDVWENALPQSYPKVVASRLPAQYVLEVSAGFFAEHHLQIGDKFESIQ